MEYSRGMMENNWDEHYYADCNCGQHYCYEPNMEGPNENIIRLPRNNVIVFGPKEYFKSYTNRKTMMKDVINQNQFNNILKDKHIYVINQPTKLNSKKELAAMIDSTLII